MIILDLPIQIAAQPQRAATELHMDSERVLLPPASAGSCVLGSWTEKCFQPNLPARALDEAEDFAIGNHVGAFVTGLVNGHAIDEPHRSRLAFKCCFEDIGAGKVSAADAILACRGNPPKPSFFDIEDGGKKRRTVKPWPAKPVQRALSRYQRCGAAIADNAVVADRGDNPASVTHSSFLSQHTYADANGDSSRWLAPVELSPIGFQ